MDLTHDQILSLTELQARVVLGLIYMGHTLSEALEIVSNWLPAKKKGQTLCTKDE